MIPNEIRDIIRKHPGRVVRSADEIPKVLSDLRNLGIKTDSQFGEFFLDYTLAGVLSRRNCELLDISSPSSEIFIATKFGRDVFVVPGGYACLTSGENEGFILYSISDEHVYDIGVAEIDDLAAGLSSPKWDSFNDLLLWYLK